jgi:hypothetical protein
MRSMLMVLDTVQKYKLNILLAKETFDPQIAPLLATSVIRRVSKSG